MRALEPSEVQRLLQVKLGRGSARQRNRALVRAFADAGLGVSEALALTPGDLDEAGLQISVRGSRDRAIRISQEAMRDLVAWSSERERLGLDDGPLFCTEAGQPLEPSYVRRFLARLGREASIDAPVNARALRESFAATRLAGGASPESLQADLGHRSHASTARYSRRLGRPGPGKGQLGADLSDALLASAHCGLVIVRAVRSPVGDITDYVFDYMNPAAAGFMRSAPERLAGRSVLERYPGAATDGTFARWSALIADQGRSGEDALRYEEAEGESVFRVRRAACGDSVVLSFEDFTQAREAESQERQRTAEVAALMDTADEGLMLLDSTGGIVSANRAAESILGVPAGGLIGRTHFDPRWRALREDGSPYPPEELPAAIAVRSGQVIRDQVVGVQLPGGGVVWLGVSAHPLEVSGGPPFAAVVAFTDLTARRSAAVADAAMAGALHLAMEGTGRLLVRCRPDGIILAAFGDPQSMIGWSCEELVGRRCAEAVHPDDAADVQCAYLDALELGSGVELRHRMIDRSGRVVAVSRTLRPVSAGGQVVEVHSLLRPA